MIENCSADKLDAGVGRPLGGIEHWVEATPSQ